MPQQLSEPTKDTRREKTIFEGQFTQMTALTLSGLADSFGGGHICDAHSILNNVWGN